MSSFESVLQRVHSVCQRVAADTSAIEKRLRTVEAQGSETLRKSHHHRRIQSIIPLRRSAKHKQQQQQVDSDKRSSSNAESEPGFAAVLRLVGGITAVVTELCDAIQLHLAQFPASMELSLREEVVGHAANDLRAEVNNLLDAARLYSGNSLDLLQQELVTLAAQRVLEANTELMRSASAESHHESGASNPTQGTQELDPAVLDSDAIFHAVDSCLAALEELTQAVNVTQRLNPEDSEERIRRPLEKFQKRVEETSDLLQGETCSDSNKRLNGSLLKVLEVACTAAASDLWSRGSDLDVEYNTVRRQFENSLKHVLLATNTDDFSWSDFTTNRRTEGDEGNSERARSFHNAAFAAISALGELIPAVADELKLEDSRSEMLVASVASAIERALRSTPGSGTDTVVKAQADSSKSSTAGGLRRRLTATNILNARDFSGVTNEAQLSPAVERESLPDDSSEAAVRSRDLASRSSIYSANEKLLRNILRARRSQVERSVGEDELSLALIAAAKEIEDHSMRFMAHLAEAVHSTIHMMHGQMLQPNASEHKETAKSTISHTESTTEHFAEVLDGDRACVSRMLDRLLLLSERFSFFDSKDAAPSTVRKLAATKTHTRLDAVSKGNQTLLSVAELSMLKQHHSLLAVVDSSRKRVEELLGSGKVSESISRALRDPMLTLTPYQYNGARARFGKLTVSRLHVVHSEFRSTITQLGTDLRWLSFEAAKSNKEIDHAFAVVTNVALHARVAAELLQSLTDSFETLRFLSRARTHSTFERQLAKHTASSELASGCYSINVWSEGDEHENPPDISNDNGEIFGADLNQLIIYLAPIKGFRFSSDIALQSFLTTFRTFRLDSHALLDKLIERAAGPAEGLSTGVLPQVQMSVLSLLRYWAEEHFSDDFDPVLVTRVRLFLAGFTGKNSGSDDPMFAELSSIAVKIGNIIEQQLAEEEVAVRSLLPFEPLPQPCTPVVSTVDMFLQFSNEEIARQLTVIESTLYRRIRPSELLDQAWNVAKRQHTAPNVSALLQRVNRVSYWVASKVLSESDVQKRASMIGKLVDVANHLLRLNNLNSLMAFVAGLHISAVARLNSTWQLVPESTTRQLSDFLQVFDPSRSYKLYRSRVASLTPPVVPYIGVTLTDLTFCDEGNADYVQGRQDIHGHKLYNFSKRITMHKIVSRLLETQRIAYKIPAVEPLQTYLLSLSGATDKELYDLSLKLEPRA